MSDGNLKGMITYNISERAPLIKLTHWFFSSGESIMEEVSKLKSWMWTIKVSATYALKVTPYYL